MQKTLLLLFIISVLNLKSQISITSANMPVMGDTGRYSNATLSTVGNYTATGANYTWDFTGMDSTGQGMRLFQPSSATPYFFYFFSPKYGEKTLDSLPIPSFPIGGLTFSIKNIYSFYKKNGTSTFNSEGLGLTMAGIPIGATNSDEDELYVLPLNYGNRDSTTFKLSTPTNTAIPFTYKKQGYRITEVDGWGTIKTPYGTEQCLRVVSTQYSIDTIKINSLSPPLNKFGFRNYARSYQWLTLNEKIPYLEVLGQVVNGNFTPTQARYRDVIHYFVGVKEQETNLALSVFPNPANTELTVLIPQNNHEITAEITDLQGKVILTTSLSRNTEMINQHLINTSALAKGLYVLNLSSSSQKQSLKISIQ